MSGRCPLDSASSNSNSGEWVRKESSSKDSAHVVQASSGLVWMFSREIKEVRQRVLNVKKEQGSDQKEHTVA